MKKLLLAFCAFLTLWNVNAQWKPEGDKLMTKWGEQLDPQNVLPEYPRPGMERAEWKNLNGKWEYAILPKGEVEPEIFDGKILVPFAVESALSGVQKRIDEKNELWYKRTFTVPSVWKGKDVLLNFGAVDWRADVFVNDVLIGSHDGGYTPFSFNITPFLKGKGEQKLVVRVWDPTDRGYQPRGKQVFGPNGIWYTPVSGIWQTVWLEPVANDYITSVKSVSDIDKEILNVTVNANTTQVAVAIVEVNVLDKGKVVASAKGVQGKTLRLAVKQPTLWEPSNPYLYDIQVKLWQKGKMVDVVKSYTAFRKISTERDKNGIMRMCLNNKPLFHYGPLDQGWWPDGLYTAPSDEALRFDIEKTKEWGFNMIRKHVKVEPARWYYHCDKLGMLVWQDMPCGDIIDDWAPREYNVSRRRVRSEASASNFYREWKEVMDFCMSNPCIVVWTPFNEGMGQFETEKVVNWTKHYDPSRLVNPASGGNHRPCGDMLDLHHYPNPGMFLFDPIRVNVLGEHGGIGLAVKDHLWWKDRNWGYVQFKNEDEVTAEYVKYANELKSFIKKGFSAAVYTQTTDVEGEINGLMTYDRKVIKIREDQVRAVNQEVIRSMTE